MNDKEILYYSGWLAGFVSAVGAIYLLQRYFPDLLTQRRTIIVRHEGSQDAATHASDRMAGSDETRADA